MKQKRKCFQRRPRVRTLGIKIGESQLSSCPVPDVFMLFFFSFTVGPKIILGTRYVTPILAHLSACFALVGAVLRNVKKKF